MTHLANLTADLQPFFVAAGPLILLAFGLVPNRVSNSMTRRFAKLAISAALIALAFAILATIGRILSGPLTLGIAMAEPVRLDLFFDSLSAIMLILVSFLGAIVIHFSKNYLAGDPRQGRFIRWMCLTIGSVLVVIISGNLLMFTLAWIATSLSLHQLLTFYPERKAALLSARKKFLISRLGDACMIGALIATWSCFGSWQFSKIFAAAHELRAAGESSNCLILSAILHLVAHSLYKAHAFLSSGSIVKISQDSWTPAERPASHPAILGGTLLAAVGVTLAIGKLFGHSFSDSAGLLLLGSIFIMALAYLLWNLWSSSHRSSLIVCGLLMVIATATVYFTLHLVFEKLLTGALPEYAPYRSAVEYFVMGLIGLAFMAVLIMQSQLPAWSATKFGRAFYVHASHGFYLGTIFNRLTLAIFKK